MQEKGEVADKCDTTICFSGQKSLKQMSSVSEQKERKTKAGTRDTTKSLDARRLFVFY